MNKKYIIIGIFAVLAIGALLMLRNPGISSVQNSAAELQTGQIAATSPSPAMSGSEQTVTPPAISLEADQTIPMDAGAFYYSVKQINAKKGERIKIIMTAVDMMHNFYIDELNVKSDTVKSGETTTFEFVAERVGTFEFYCNVGQHRQNGQVGKITIIE